MNQNITIIRKYKGVGIDSHLNGYDLATTKPLPRKVYHGRMVYLLDGKQIGLPSIRKDANRCKIIFDNSIPF